MESWFCWKRNLSLIFGVFVSLGWWLLPGQSLWAQTPQSKKGTPGTQQGGKRILPKNRRVRPNDVERLLWSKAETLRRKAASLYATSRARRRATKVYQQALDIYRRLVKTKTYKRRALAAMISCYEFLSKRANPTMPHPRAGHAKPREWARGVVKAGKEYKVKWIRLLIRPRSWDFHLVQAYQRYQKLLVGPTDQKELNHFCEGDRG